MRLRPVRFMPLLVALVAVSSPVVAEAAKAPAKPKPICNLLTSPRAAGLITGDLAPEMDILSGDVASGPKEIGATLRLASVDWVTNHLSKLGMRWQVRFTAKGADYLFKYTASGTGTFLKNGSAVSVTPKVTIDKKNKAIIWTVPRTAAPDLKKQVYREIAGNTHFNGMSQDGATATKTHPDQHPSCLKVK